MSALPTQMHLLRDQALAAQLRANEAESHRYNNVADMHTAAQVGAVTTEAAQRARWLSRLQRLESEMATQHNRAAQHDTSVRANPASPERARVARPLTHLSY